MILYVIINEVKEVITLSKLKKNYDKFLQIIVDDKKRNRVQLYLVFMLFLVISFVFSIFNLISKTYPLLIATSSFTVLCAINLLILRFAKHGIGISKTMFELEMMSLFTFFIMSGGIEGFSIIWLLVLPTCGLLFFGRRHGLILISEMFVILLFFMIVKFDFVFPYTDTFRLRFPFVYLAATAIAYLLEFLRETTHKELVSLQQKYESLYKIDALTKAYNRYGFTSAFNALLENDENTKVALAIMDIDDFKHINDTYGHLVGDEVLKAVAKTIDASTIMQNDLFRWGGEEFAVLFQNVESGEAISTCEKIRKNIEALVIKVDGIEIKLTISLGLIITKCLKDKVELEKRLYTADKMLYNAKANGKNCLKYHDYTN